MVAPLLGRNSLQFFRAFSRRNGLRELGHCYSKAYFPVYHGSVIGADIVLLPKALNHGQQRYYASDRERNTPSVTKLPKIIWPNIFKSIRNWLLTNLIIRPHFDSEFTIPEFVRGAKQALVYISNCLSEGDFQSLKGLVAAEVLPNIKHNVSLLDAQQRSELRVKMEDICFSFPYQIGIIFLKEDSDEELQKRFVEITMCFHIIRGLGELQASVETFETRIPRFLEQRENVILCNYRFIREFTKGVEGEWVVNFLDHFKPVDLERN